MPSVRFTGRVLPAALNVSIPNHPTFTWKADELGLDMTFHVQIQDGSITIDCDVTKFDESAHLLPLFVRASEIARTCVDLVAFTTGNGLTAVLEIFTNPAGTSIPLAAQRPSLGAFVTASKMGTADFDKALQVVLAEPILSMALRDLIEAISSPARAAAIVLWNARRLPRNSVAGAEGASSDQQIVLAKDNTGIDADRRHRSSLDRDGSIFGVPEARRSAAATIGVSAPDLSEASSGSALQISQGAH